MKTIKELENQVEELKAEIEELKKSEEKQGGRWKPKEDERYYLISASGEICTDIYKDCSVDKYRHAIGNCFRTKEEAEFEVKRLKVITELKEFTESDDAVWGEGDCHWYIYFEAMSGYIEVEYDISCKFGNLYFPSEETAREAIKAVGEDRVKRFYLRVKEEL